MLTGNELTPDPTPPPQVGRLNSLRDVQRELIRVYRDMRRGKIPSQEGARLAYVLVALARIIEGGDLEQRVEALEQGLRGE